MKTTQSLLRYVTAGVGTALAITLAAAGVLVGLGRPVPFVSSWLEKDAEITGENDTTPGGNTSSPHEEVHLSDDAKTSIGLRLARVRRGDFQKSISVPAIIVEQPGISRVEVGAPLTGIVTEVLRTEGESIERDAPLMKLRLTHEELVQTQRSFLGTVEEMDVVQQEIERIKQATMQGAIAGRQLLERTYELQKLRASQRTFRQALLLHGLSDSQIDAIYTDRELLREIVVRPLPAADAGTQSQPLLHVQDLLVSPGTHVQVGQTMVVLSDHRFLYVEGRAFAKDAPTLEAAAQRGDTFAVDVESVGSEQAAALAALQLVYIENEIEAKTRTLHFYLRLPNEILADDTRADGRRFVRWRFRPGQRGQVRVPTQVMKNQLIVPASAIVDDGAESYVFVRHGDHFDRLTVSVLARDYQSAVLDVDIRKLRVGHRVVVQGAYQMHLDLESASDAAGAHHGHSH